MSVGVVLVAAGQGTRLGADRPKALVPLGGEPILMHALRGVLGCEAVTSLVVVAPAARLAEVADIVAQVPTPDRVRVEVVVGGAERTHSVQRGLSALCRADGKAPPEIVLVHDAARALAPPTVFDRVIAAVRAGHAAVVPALPVVDTVKTVQTRPTSGPEPVVGTVDRVPLRAVQTPQGFARETLTAAYAHGAEVATDDAGLVEAGGGAVHTVLGDVRAMKITTNHDLEVAATWLPRRPAALVLLGGSPGVGKTTVARELARRRGAAHLRIDTIEQALLRSRGAAGSTLSTPEGYVVATAVAGDLLTAGVDVVADATHLVAESRQGWLAAASAAGAHVIQVRLSCADEEEHRRRVEQRPADIEGHRLPTWERVASAEVEPWSDLDLHLDTGTLSVGEVVARIEEVTR